MMSLIFAAIGTVFAGLWMILFIKYQGRYVKHIHAIESGTYLLPELFFIGFGFIDMFHISVNNKHANRMIKMFAELKGAKNCKFYFFVNLAGQVTYILTMCAIGFLVAAVADLGIALLFIVVGVLLAVYLDYDVKSKVDKRREEIILSFPHVLSKISLLISAGMPLREVIGKLAYSKDEILYTELGIMQDEINNGVDERKAMSNFAVRCGVQEVRKFATLMIQNMEKGSREMAESLSEMSGEIWRERTSKVRQMGEKASAKLLVPIVMIFLGIMIMVLVPMLSSVSM